MWSRKMMWPPWTSISENVSLVSSKLPIRTREAGKETHMHWCTHTPPYWVILYSFPALGSIALQTLAALVIPSLIFIDKINQTDLIYRNKCTRTYILRWDLKSHDLREKGSCGPSRNENLGRYTRRLVGTPGKRYPQSKGEPEIDQPS